MQRTTTYPEPAEQVTISCGNHPTQPYPPPPELWAIKPKLVSIRLINYYFAAPSPQLDPAITRLFHTDEKEKLGPQR